MKFWTHPEFIGRAAVTVTLDILDKDAMIRILCRAKNALVKQYKKLFELDGVSLNLTGDALKQSWTKRLRERPERVVLCNHEAVTLDLDVSYSIR